MNEQQEMAGVAEALGTWKAAGKAVLAIHRSMSEKKPPTEEEREYFHLLVGLFRHASRGAEKVEARRVSLGIDSVRDYSAFLDVAGAVLASSPRDERGEFVGVVKRLFDAADTFSRGEMPVESEALFLSHVLRAIATFNAHQASEFFFAPQPSL